MTGRTCRAAPGGFAPRQMMPGRSVHPAKGGKRGASMRLTRLAPALAAGLLILPGLRADSPKPADDRVRETVDERLSEWRPKPVEKRFDQIGWAADIRAALRLAVEHRRPVFLFTMDGRVNLGR